GLDAFYKVFSSALGNGRHADHLRKLFADAYLKNDNLADATRFLANELFGKYGLVIIDADEPELKRQFIPFAKQEFEHQLSHQKLEDSSGALGACGVQVIRREINLFYRDPHLRERIVYSDRLYRVNNTSLVFSKDELM